MPRGRRAGQDIPSGASDLRIPCFPRLEGGADWHDTSRVMPGRYHADIIGGITTLEGLGLMALAPFDLFVAVKPHFLAWRHSVITRAHTPSRRQRRNDPYTVSQGRSLWVTCATDTPSY